MEFLGSKKVTKKDFLKKLPKKDRRDLRGRIGRESKGARSAPGSCRAEGAKNLLKKNLLKTMCFFFF